MKQRSPIRGTDTLTNTAKCGKMMELTSSDGLQIPQKRRSGLVFEGVALLTSGNGTTEYSRARQRQVPQLRARVGLAAAKSAKSNRTSRGGF